MNVDDLTNAKQQSCSKLCQAHLQVQAFLMSLIVLLLALFGYFVTETATWQALQ